MVLNACPLKYTVERNRREEAMPVLPTEKNLKKTAVFCKSTTVLLQKWDWVWMGVVAGAVRV